MGVIIPFPLYTCMYEANGPAYLKAAASLGLMREDIADSIESIPFTIDIVYKVSRSYNSDTMQSHVSQLFVAILDLLQECLKWLTKDSFLKATSTMFRGG